MKDGVAFDRVEYFETSDGPETALKGQAGVAEENKSEASSFVYDEP